MVKDTVFEIVFHPAYYKIRALTVVVRYLKASMVFLSVDFYYYERSIITTTIFDVNMKKCV